MVKYIIYSKYTRNFVNNHRRAIEITRNVVAIASIALIAIPLVAPVAIPAMAIAALGIVEVGLDLAVGDNTSAVVGLLCLFPMGKGFKYVTEVGGDAIKGGSKAKNLYKAEGLLEMNLQKFGNGPGKASSLQFRNRMLLDSHYEKHVIKQGEFGNITKIDYLKGAQNLVDSPGNDILTKVRKNRDIVFYRQSTNEFAIKTKEGIIRTYFKPKGGIDYFNAQ
ncbi:hypothetical protein [Clostridium sporogenes]